MNEIAPLSKVTRRDEEQVRLQNQPRVETHIRRDGKQVSESVLTHVRRERIIQSRDGALMHPVRRRRHQHLAVHILPTLALRSGVAFAVELFERPLTARRTHGRHAHKVLGSAKERQAVTRQRIAPPPMERHQSNAYGERNVKPSNHQTIKPSLSASTERTTP